MKVLGIEFGSTRIKAVLADAKGRVLSAGVHSWENRLLAGGVWSYRLEDAVAGMQAAYAALKADFKRRTGRALRSFDAFGVSGMMHGYLPFDAKGRQLSPFRTWRCTITAEASEKLSKALDFTMPQRWSATHLYQRLLDGAPETGKIAFLSTLATWIHFRLTGEKAAGVGEASGMFPVDPATGTYDLERMRKFDSLASRRGAKRSLADILPRPLVAGEQAGRLSAAGAALLDPSGDLAPGALAAPPEGDVQTGMVATNSIRRGTVNVSAGTSAFAIVSLERPLGRRNPNVDVALSPTGIPLAMSHSNTCTSDINAWAALLGGDYDRLFRESLKGAPDCGGVVTVPYLSGEPVAGVPEGRPLVMRLPGADFSLANFMRANVYSAFATLRMSLDILFSEGVSIKGVIAHGGIFKTPGVAQQYLADALGVPVTCLSTAGEGCAWGMAVLAAFSAARAAGERRTLERYLAEVVFNRVRGTTLAPTARGKKGFATYMENFKKALAAERAAI